MGGNITSNTAHCIRDGVEIECVRCVTLLEFGMHARDEGMECIRSKFDPHIRREYGKIYVRQIFVGTTDYSFNVRFIAG